MAAEATAVVVEAEAFMAAVEVLVAVVASTAADQTAVEDTVAEPTAADRTAEHGVVAAAMWDAAVMEADQGPTPAEVLPLRAPGLQTAIAVRVTIPPGFIRLRRAAMWAPVLKHDHKDDLAQTRTHVPAIKRSLPITLRSPTGSGTPLEPNAPRQ
jgi:hypothetical protein